MNEAAAHSSIKLRGVRVHNLKNIDVDIPRKRFVLITGVSGSGKSSLALDTLYAEGQRRYVESFSAYARQFLERMDKPDVDSVENIPPAIAIEQKNPVKNRRSTVGTATELNDYLRLLFARVGQMFCPGCDRKVEAWTVSRAVERVLGLAHGARFLVTFPVTFSRRLSGREQMESIREMGFVRLWLGDQVVDITNMEGFSPETDGAETEVVVDRLLVEPGARERLAEAVETCYRLGHGECRVRPLEGDVMVFNRKFRCSRCDIDLPDLTPQLFSFNSPLGACPECNGYGATICIDPQKVVPDPRLSLREGAVAPWRTKSTQECLDQLLEGAPTSGIPVDVPWEKLTERQRKAVFDGTRDFYGVFDFFNWLESKKYRLHVRVLLSRYRAYRACPTCDGTRLRKPARSVRISGRDIAQVSAMSIEQARRFFHKGVELSPYEQQVSELVLNEISSRLDYLCRVGLGYLTLDRHTRTLSGGEMQRLNLTTSLGSALVNTLYILDEPSVGLHPRDNDRLIRIIRSLRDRGNTVVVVEHDRRLIDAGDHVIDLGPGSGERGGQIVYSGPTDGLAECDGSVTGAYLRGEARIPVPAERRKPGKERLRLRGARAHNLKNINVDIPLGLFLCITGVSGSGKSSLVHDTLYGAIRRGKPGGYPEEIGEYDSLRGDDLIEDVELVSQGAIGETPRSNPVTYIKAYDEIRRLFASTRSARIRNLGPGVFSFNTRGGRCEQCEGAGSIKVDMQFLADVHVTCGKCDGRRFQKNILDVKYRGASIHDVLAMTVAKAMRFFADNRKIVSRLRFLYDTGLGYLKLGQSATTLSGGEAQRLKLARRMANSRRNKVLFLFDEPTIGLHFDDIRKLLSCFQRLVSAGNTVLVIEHNLDVIKCADYVIDLGPGEGERGGKVVVRGTPEQVAACERSHTGRYLRDLLPGG